MRIRAAKALVFLAALAPAAWLFWRQYHHQLGINWIEKAQRTTGDWTLRFLLLALCVTPLRRLPRMAWLIRFRRMLGLFAFAYGCLHATIYLLVDKALNWTIIREDFAIRRFYIAGLIAFVLMIPLALTSTAGAIRLLGGARWRLLHRLVYLSAIAGVVHYYWQGKYIVLDPILYGIAVFLLLASRLLLLLREPGS
jgi:methionine sulfoxide reductase heme-binding subunit